MHLTPAAAVDLAAAAPQVHGHGAGVYQDQRREAQSAGARVAGTSRATPTPISTQGSNRADTVTAPAGRS